MELESQQTEFQRKITTLEAELRRSKERLTDNQVNLDLNSTKLRKVQVIHDVTNILAIKILRTKMYYF